MSDEQTIYTTLIQDLTLSEYFEIPKYYFAEDEISIIDYDNNKLILEDLSSSIEHIKLYNHLSEDYFNGCQGKSCESINNHHWECGC